MCQFNRLGLILCGLGVCACLISTARGQTPPVYFGLSQDGRPIPDVNKIPFPPLPSPPFPPDNSCWLASASNILAAAGYGTGGIGTAQQRADMIYNQLKAAYGTLYGGAPDQAISYWLAWHGKNPSSPDYQPMLGYTDVTAEYRTLGPADYAFLQGELYGGQYVGVQFHNPAHAVTFVGWNDSIGRSTWTDSDRNVGMNGYDSYTNSFTASPANWDLVDTSFNPPPTYLTQANGYVTFCPGLNKSPNIMANYDVAWAPSPLGPQAREAGAMAVMGAFDSVLNSSFGLGWQAQWIDPNPNNQGATYDPFRIDNQPDLTKQKHIELLVDYYNRDANNINQDIRLKYLNAAGLEVVAIPTSTQLSADNGQVLFRWELEIQPGWEELLFPSYQGYNTLEGIVASWDVATICVFPASATVTLTGPLDGARFMTGTVLAGGVTGTVTNSALATPNLTVSLSSQGTLAIANLTPVSSSLAPGSSTTFTGDVTVAAGANTLIVRNTDASAIPTTADSQTVTIDGVSQRVVTADAVNLGPQHTGANLSTTTFTSTLRTTGDDSSNTRVTVNGTLFGDAGVTSAITPAGPALVAASGSMSTTYAVTGEGLTGEGAYSNVSVAYSATLYSGIGVWNTTGTAAWSNFGNWTADGGAPGLAAGFQTGGDTAAFSGTGGTVTLNDSPVVGSVTFNSASSYAIAVGGGTLTLAGGSAAINNTAGSHSIAAPVQLASTATATVSGASDTLTISGKISGEGIIKAGPGTLVLTGANDYAGLTTIASGVLELGTVAARSPVLTGAGANIQAGKLVFDYTDSSDNPKDSVKTILTASYNNGTTPFAVGNGAKIYSTPNLAGRALGWADDTAAKKVTVMYTLFGDATLDGTVNFDDLNKVLTSYNQSGTWATGDFTYDGNVNFDDLNKVLTAYNTSLGAGDTISGAGLDGQAINMLSGSGFTVVPEPSSVVLMLAGLMGLLAYGWRKRK